MLNQDEKDRRGAIRVDFDTDVTVSAEGYEVHYTGSSRDISLRGIFVKTTDLLDVGTRCRVEIRLIGVQDDVSLIMEGHVIRTEAIGFAVYFDSVDLDSYAHLKNIVKYNAPESDNDTV